MPVKRKAKSYSARVFFATFLFGFVSSDFAAINECLYGNSGGMCYVGSYGDEPDMDGKKPAPGDYVDPEDGRNRGDADSLSDAPPLWNSGTAFVGTPTGSTGPSSSGSAINFLQVSAEQKMKSNSHDVANATRPEGPCYRPQALESGVTNVLPSGTQFFIGLNWSKSMDADVALVFNSALITMADNMNQWFGSTPATTLQGQTMSDLASGVTPLNYHFQVYFSLDEANSAAAHYSGASKLVIPVSEINLPKDKDGNVAIGLTDEKVINGLISSASIYFNLAYVENIKNSLNRVTSDASSKQFMLKSIIFDNVLNISGPHEIGHVLGLEHITLTQPVDDDYSPLVYGGARSYDFKRFLGTGQEPTSPFSSCDAVMMNANR